METKVMYLNPLMSFLSETGIKKRKPIGTVSNALTSRSLPGILIPQSNKRLFNSFVTILMY